MKEAKKTESKESKKRSWKKIVFAAFLIGVLAVVAAGAFYYFGIYQKEQELKNNPTLASDRENQKVIAAVGKLIKLPNETPSVATVSDITKLRDQTLFHNAQNGDKVLIFDKAKRAIVYRPSENLIIEIGNVVVAPDSTPSASSENKKVRVAIFNGTGTAGYARTVGNDLSSKFENMEIAGTENASGSYSKTLVIDLSGNNTVFAKSLAGELDGEVGSLPSSESRPNNADVLVILGN